MNNEYGLELFWSSDEALKLQGVTELWRPQRCKDVWYNELIEECRNGNLSDDNYNFLHGKETTVPGSWEEGRPRCGEKACLALANASWARIEAEECDVCKDERRTKRRVLASEGSTALREGLHQCARDLRKQRRQIRDEQVARPRVCGQSRRVHYVQPSEGQALRGGVKAEP